MIGIILLLASTILLIIMSINSVTTPTPTPKPILKNKKVEMVMSHAMTNHITSELMRQKAELSRNNYPGNEYVTVKKISWAPSVN